MYLLVMLQNTAKCCCVGIAIHVPCSLRLLPRKIFFSWIYTIYTHATPLLLFKSLLCCLKAFFYRTRELAVRKVWCTSTGQRVCSCSVCGERSRTTVLLRASLPGLWKTPSGQLPCHNLSVSVLSVYPVRGQWPWAELVRWSMCLCQLLLFAVRYFSTILIYMGNLTREWTGIHAFLSALQERHNAQKRGKLSSREQEYLMQEDDVMGVVTHHCPRMGGYLAAAVAGLSVFCSTRDIPCQKPHCCSEDTKAMQQLARLPRAATQTQHILRLSAQSCFPASAFLTKQHFLAIRKNHISAEMYDVVHTCIRISLLLYRCHLALSLKWQNFTSCGCYLLSITSTPCTARLEQVTR